MTDISMLLIELSDAMAQEGLITTEPKPEAFASTQPFCLDSMSFEQWLKYVFIARLTMLVANNQPLPQLPKGQGISPMAVEALKEYDCPLVLGKIAELDDYLAQP